MPTAAILQRAYETLHPGLLRYNTPVEMQEAIAGLDREFQRDRTLADAHPELRSGLEKTRSELLITPIWMEVYKQLISPHGDAAPSW